MKLQSKMNSIKIDIENSEDNRFKETSKISTNVDIEQNNESETQITKEQLIDFNNWFSWPPINNQIRTLLVSHGPGQGKNSDFYFSQHTISKRRFSVNWFNKMLPNGEHIEHLWLIYSDKTKSLYRFPCMIFSTITTKLILDY